MQSISLKPAISAGIDAADIVRRGASFLLDACGFISNGDTLQQEEAQSAPLGLDFVDLVELLGGDELADGVQPIVFRGSSTTFAMLIDGDGALRLFLRDDGAWTEVALLDVDGEAASYSALTELPEFSFVDLGSIWIFFSTSFTVAHPATLEVDEAYILFDRMLASGACVHRGRVLVGGFGTAWWSDDMLALFTSLGLSVEQPEGSHLWWSSIGAVDLFDNITAPSLEVFERRAERNSSNMLLLSPGYGSILKLLPFEGEEVGVYFDSAALLLKRYEKSYGIVELSYARGALVAAGVAKGRGQHLFLDSTRRLCALDGAGKLSNLGFHVPMTEDYITGTPGARFSYGPYSGIYDVFKLGRFLYANGRLTSSTYFGELNSFITRERVKDFSFLLEDALWTLGSGFTISGPGIMAFSGPTQTYAEPAVFELPAGWYLVSVDGAYSSIGDGLSFGTVLSYLAPEVFPASKLIYIASGLDFRVRSAGATPAVGALTKVSLKKVAEVRFAEIDLFRVDRLDRIRFAFSGRDLTKEIKVIVEASTDAGSSTSYFTLGDSSDLPVRVSGQRFKLTVVFEQETALHLEDVLLSFSEAGKVTL